MADTGSPLVLIVLSSAFERVHYALATAAAAAAADRPATLFFTQGAVRAIAGTPEVPGWARLTVADPGLGGGDAATLDRAFRARGAAGIEELLAACKELRVSFLVCSMGLRVEDVARGSLRSDLAVEETGLIDVLSRGGTLTFI
jgi:uncharacterized protein